MKNAARRTLPRWVLHMCRDSCSFPFVCVWLVVGFFFTCATFENLEACARDPPSGAEQAEVAGGCKRKPRCQGQRSRPGSRPRPGVVSFPSTSSNGSHTSFPLPLSTHVINHVPSTSDLPCFNDRTSSAVFSAFCYFRCWQCLGNGLVRRYVVFFQLTCKGPKKRERSNGFRVLHVTRKHEGGRNRM